MSHKSICYHTRLSNDNTKKICGGSFSGQLDLDTANQLVSAHFTVAIKNSGRAVFVDREGREVSLYISVDPSDTIKGREAIAADRKERAIREAEAAKKEAELQSQLDDLIETHGMERAIELLKTPEAKPVIRKFKVLDSSNLPMNVNLDGQVLDFVRDLPDLGQVLLLRTSNGGVVSFDYKNVEEVFPNQEQQ